MSLRDGFHCGRLATLHFADRTLQTVANVLYSGKPIMGQASYAGFANQDGNV